MSQEEEVPKSRECYSIHANVKTFVKNTLNLERDMNRWKVGKSAWGMAQQDVTECNQEKFRRRKRSLDSRKVKILNAYIFPSMAIITYFMEELARSPLLYDIFEEEIKELFLGVGEKEEEGMVFHRFVRAVVSRPIAETKKGGRNEGESPDFRINGSWTLPNLLSTSAVKSVILSVP
jgi:hypothetical protein